jgi:hypothetical protein
MERSCEHIKLQNLPFHCGMCPMGTTYCSMEDPVFWHPPESALMISRPRAYPAHSRSYRKYLRLLGTQLPIKAGET